jgi:hypothetical protein
MPTSPPRPMKISPQCSCLALSWLLTHITYCPPLEIGSLSPMQYNPLAKSLSQRIPTASIVGTKLSVSRHRVLCIAIPAATWAQLSSLISLYNDPYDRSYGYPLNRSSSTSFGFLSGMSWYNKYDQVRSLRCFNRSCLIMLECHVQPKRAPLTGRTRF